MNTPSALLCWDAMPICVDLRNTGNSLILEIDPQRGQDSIAPTHIGSVEPGSHAARLFAAAAIVLELDASIARSVRQGSTAQLNIRPPRPSTSRTIISAEDAAALRPSVEELIAPLLFGSLPHPPLRPFQDFGIKWLLERRVAILADDMGLGKTAQALLALQKLVTNGTIRGALVVCPKSLVANWENECTKWTPALTVLRSAPHKANATQVWRSVLGRSHVIVANYEQLRPLPHALRVSHLDLLIADEAHRLRRSQAQLVKAFRGIKCSRFWAMTGTPIERDTLDLATLLSLLEPTRFSMRSTTVKSELKSLARPYILRRLKTDVLSELPRVIDTKETIELSSAQQRSYSAVQEKALSPDSNGILQRLLLLRSICDVDLESNSSTKLDRIVQILHMIQDLGEKAIVFSHMLRPLQLLSHRLSRHQPCVPTLSLTGQMAAEARTGVLRRFKSDDRVVALLCSSRIGGEGLTLVEANHVIFVNEWWNPSANSQARDRVVRLGQKRVVHVHRFRCKNTVEELLDLILERKERTFADIVDGLAREVRLEGFDAEEAMNAALRLVDTSIEER